VFLAKQLDNSAPDYMQVELEGNNSELGDAYTWLGATESALGKNVEVGLSLSGVRLDTWK
jgi:hypothetical protein